MKNLLINSFCSDAQGSKRLFDAKAINVVELDTKWH
jgi:hypothetical protein